METQQKPQDPIPGYKIVEKIGSGGMGMIFKARDIKNRRIVALKILFPQKAQNKKSLDQFIREANLLIEFEHENIVKGYECGFANNLHYLTMEFLDGLSIQSMLDQQGKLDEETALYIILQISCALDYMQSKGIVHRDIKPDNIIMLRDNRIKLLDLGFAKPIGSSDEQEDTTCGTVQYMSPEQAKGQSDVDVRSDIYSLGATLYHLATGETPFKGTDNLEIMAAQVINELQGGELKSKISEHMHYFIEKMMAKDREIRYQSPAEVIQDIEEQISGFKSLEFNPAEAETSIDLITGGGSQKKQKTPPHGIVVPKNIPQQPHKPVPEQKKTPSDIMRRISRLEEFKKKFKK